MYKHKQASFSRLHLLMMALQLRPSLGSCTNIFIASQPKTYYSALAQLVEQLTVNQRVAGSSPAGGAISFNDLHTFQLTSKCPLWGFCGVLVSGSGPLLISAQMHAFAYNAVGG